MANRPTGEGRRPQRRDRLIREREHDPYKAREKHPEPTVCPDCEAVYRDGRWQWVEGPFGIPSTVCPACQRIRDDYPAGYVTLKGEFLAEHREEILSLARNLEEREKVDHPLKRIMAIREEEDGLVVTTTDMHLARLVGESIYRAYQGEIDYQYSKEGNVLRVVWNR